MLVGWSISPEVLRAGAHLVVGKEGVGFYSKHQLPCFQRYNDTDQYSVHNHPKTLRPAQTAVRSDTYPSHVSIHQVEVLEEPT